MIIYISDKNTFRQLFQIISGVEYTMSQEDEMDCYSLQIQMEDNPEELPLSVAGKSFNELLEDQISHEYGETKSLSSQRNKVSFKMKYWSPKGKRSLMYVFDI